MQKATAQVFILLKNSFLITAVALITAALSRNDSFFEQLFGTIGMYGAIFTANLFLFHLILCILLFIMKKNNPDR